MIKITLIVQPSLDRLHGDPIPFYLREPVDLADSRPDAEGECRECTEQTHSK